MKSIRLAAVLLILVTSCAVVQAQYVENRTEYNPETTPYGLDLSTEYKLNNVLADIASRSPTLVDVRFIAIDQGKIEATGYPITLETYRDAVLDRFDESYRQSREVFVIVWVADQDRIWISIPERAFERISLPLVQHIIDQEYVARIGNGQSRQSAIFETVTHLGRYFAVATDTAPQYDQTEVPAGAWPYYDYAVHSMIVARKPDTTPAQYGGEMFVQTELPTVTAQSESGGRNQLVIIGVFFAIMLCLVLVFIRIRRNRNKDDDDYVEEYDEDEDESDDDYEE